MTQRAPRRLRRITNLILHSFHASKYRPCSRSEISPGSFGFQPSSVRVRSLDVGLSRAAKGANQPKWLLASSSDLLTTGTFRRRPITSATSRNDTPSSATSFSKLWPHRGGDYAGEPVVNEKRRDQQEGQDSGQKKGELTGPAPALPSLSGPSRDCGLKHL